ncbi:MAG TPA: hypothetical protein VN495_01735 [Candidatus Paceibacterota bacterium]|nr:hypothetical protein [Candidatus Paceibacterota bacterium]
MAEEKSTDDLAGMLAAIGRAKTVSELLGIAGAFAHPFYIFPAGFDIGAVKQAFKDRTKAIVKKQRAELTKRLAGLKTK